MRPFRARREDAPSARANQALGGGSSGATRAESGASSDVAGTLGTATCCRSAAVEAANAGAMTQCAIVRQWSRPSPAGASGTCAGAGVPWCACSSSSEADAWLVAMSRSHDQAAWAITRFPMVSSERKARIRRTIGI